jgi:hypothetical protein
LPQIAENAGRNGFVVLANVVDQPFGYGWNAATDTYEDLVAAGVVDPAKVTTAAIRRCSGMAIRRTAKRRYGDLGICMCTYMGTDSRHNPPRYRTAPLPSDSPPVVSPPRPAASRRRASATRHTTLPPAAATATTVRVALTKRSSAPAPPRRAAGGPLPTAPAASAAAR